MILFMSKNKLDRLISEKVSVAHDRINELTLRVIELENDLKSYKNTVDDSITIYDGGPPTGQIQRRFLASVSIKEAVEMILAHLDMKLEFGGWSIKRK